jgi:membrane protease YdiL (CAAX protease family)
LPQGVHWYVFAAGFMLTIKLTAAVLYHLILGSWPEFGHEALYIMLIATIFSTPVQAGEEIGWRGFALPRLAQHMGLACGSIVLGAIWACWHLPLFFLPGLDTTGQSFPLYLLQVIAISVIMAWLLWRTNGSLLIVMLLHAAINNTKDIVPSIVPGATNPLALSTSAVACLTLLLLWICATYFLFQMRGVKLDYKPK